MKASHATGGTIGVALGALLAGLLARYHVTRLSETDCVFLGGALLAAGVAVAHAVWTVGLGPLFARIIHGPPPATITTAKR